MSAIAPTVTPRVVAARLALALLLGSASLLVTAPGDALAQPPPLEPPAECTEPPAATSAESSLEERDAEKRFRGDAFVRTELFFGSERPDLPEVSPEEFKQFLDVVVTPCFPDGLTLLSGKGQFRESDGRIVQETSFVLVLLYPVDARKQSHAKIEAIRTIYKDHFQQESVLRADDPRAVRVGF
jgi:hypothetical protein